MPRAKKGKTFKKETPIYTPGSRLQKQIEKKRYWLAK